MKYTYCEFDEASKKSYFAILRYLLCLQDPTLILLSFYVINPDVDHRCKNNTDNPDNKQKQQKQQQTKTMTLFTN